MRPHGPRRIVLSVAALVGIVALGLGINSDMHTRSQLRQAQASLSSARSKLQLTLRSLSTDVKELKRTTGQRDTLQSELTTTSDELASAEASLSTSKAGLSAAQNSLASQGIDIAILNTCLAGVEQALNQIAVGDNTGAVNSISGVSTSCHALQAEGKGGPVFPFDFPDPDVIRVGGTYYGYATNSAGGNIQTVQSTDLTHWTLVGNALPRLPQWARAGDTWAPGVFGLGGRFLLYYAAVDAASGKECVSVAVAPDPQGPFVDGSVAPLVCQLDLGGSLDPSPFLDATGTPYLVWKSQGVRGQVPAIWSQQLTADGTALAGQSPRILVQPTQSWEGGIVEGPFVVPWSGRYYVFYSANNWNSPDYAIGVAICQGPTGPCSKLLDHALVASQGAFSGPGGPSLFTDSQGELWIAFHGWLPTAVGYPNSRFLFLRPVTFDANLPVVASAPNP